MRTIRNIRTLLFSSATVLALAAGTSAAATAQEWQGPQGGPGQGKGHDQGQDHGGGSAECGTGEHESGEAGGCSGGGSEHEGSEGGSPGHQPIVGGKDSGRGAGNQAGGQGGDPSWSHEGIPEVELGRLNVARSPNRVLDRAFNEVIATFDPATMAELYEMSAAEFAAAVASRWDAVAIIDSPLQNLSLLRELWTTGQTSLPGVEPRNLLELSGILLGTASDKTVPISNDTVRALAVIMRVSMSEATVSAIASRAGAVRRGILAGHG